MANGSIEGQEIPIGGDDLNTFSVKSSVLIGLWKPGIRGGTWREIYVQNFMGQVWKISRLYRISFPATGKE